MNTYKFRAECLYDVTQFMLKAGHLIETLKMEPAFGKKFPDKLVTIKGCNDIEKILDAILAIESDAHIMYETLQPSRKYDGERIRNYGTGLTIYNLY